MQGCASPCRRRYRLLPLHRWCSSQWRRRRWPGGSAGESGRRRSEGCGRGSRGFDACLTGVAAETRGLVRWRGRWSSPQLLRGCGPLRSF
jgi:hypothetical protein